MEPDFIYDPDTKKKKRKQAPKKDQGSRKPLRDRGRKPRAQAPKESSSDSDDSDQPEDLGHKNGDNVNGGEVPKSSKLRGPGGKGLNPGPGMKLSGDDGGQKHQQMANDKTGVTVNGATNGEGDDESVPTEQD